MLSSRPYLLRGVNEWIIDSGLTPHLLVDAGHPGLQVPPSSIRDGRVVLNISPTAVRDLIIDNEMITFVARFGGVSQAITIPMPAVMAVYARENGRGMMFADEDDQGHQEPAADPGSEKPDDNGGSGRPRPHLKVVK
ncbi:MAG TPA: ClpXP protease specificity-enhancing factor [Wenzhouxiangella sp.]|nr:ClpXP protease specificity-enhancing factor [Wenzhouxiangella sp.]